MHEVVRGCVGPMRMVAWIERRRTGEIDSVSDAAMLMEVSCQTMPKDHHFQASSMLDVIYGGHRDHNEICSVDFLKKYYI